MEGWRQRLSDITATRPEERSHKHRAENRPACWRNNSQQLVRLARGSETEAVQCVKTA
jgi:hypothetical protein